MELDELKQKWVEQDRKLDTAIRLSRALLLAGTVSRVRWPIRRFAFGAGMGALFNLPAALLLGSFIYRHWTEPRFLLPALVLHIWVIANLAASIRQMVMALQIDYAQPVAAIQKQIEALRIFRIQVTRWSLLTGQLVWWTPFLIVAIKGFLGLDVYAIAGAPFLLGNIAVGLAVIPLAIWLTRKLGNRRGGSSLMRTLTRDLAGYNLNAATGFLATLDAFEHDSL